MNIVFIILITALLSYNIGAYYGQKELEDSFDLIEKSDESVGVRWVISYILIERIQIN